MNQIKFVLFMTLPLLLTLSCFASAASVDANLIANPGFEGGSAKPLNWIFAGSNGYVTIWNTVSHSCTRSINISLHEKTMINSVYLLSDSFQVEPLKEYTLSAWVKSEGVVGRPTVIVVQYDASMKSISQLNLEFNICTNGSMQKQFDLKTLSNSAYVMVYANFWSGYRTFWLDDVRLTLKNSKSKSIPLPISTPAPYSTPVSGSMISINPDKTLNINGKKTFPVFMYDICNSYYELSKMVEPCNPSKNNEFLFSAGGEYYQNFGPTNLKSKYEQTNIFYTMMGDQINSIPQDLINSPNFFGYYHLDEPGLDKLRNIKNTYNTIKIKDPKHPVIMNHWLDMKIWAPYSDILAWDIYPYRETSSWSRKDTLYAYEHLTETSFFKDTNINGISKPVWAVIQADAISGGGSIILNPKEVRANTYTAITMDAKGIGFWGYLSWSDLNSSPRQPYGTRGLYNNKILHNYYRQLGRELTSINDILVLPTKDYSWEYRKGTMVSFSKTLTKTVLWKTRSNFNYILKQGGDKWYLIVVNKDSRAISNVGITINALSGIRTANTLGLETSSSGRAGRILSVNNGLLTDSFDGLAVHIYQLS